MAENTRQSILDMANGAFKERVDYEMSRVVDNILDINTAASKKRTLTATIELVPNADRQRVHVHVSVKSKLEPTEPVTTDLYITPDHNGEITAVEMVPHVPGQQGWDGAEQEEPVALRLIRGA